MLTCAGACRAVWSPPPLLRILQTLGISPRSYKTDGRRTGTLRSDTTTLLCLLFSTPAETQDGKSHQAVHFSAWPRYPWKTTPSQFGFETGGLVLSQEEAPMARLLPLAATSTSFQPANAQVALGSARALLGLSPRNGWAHSPLTLL